MKFKIIFLQENNAIAVVDLETENISHVHGLGYKDWRQSEIDVSDTDGGELSTFRLIIF